MLPGMMPVVGGDVRDPYFANVSLLLHGDGTDNGTTIMDSSPSANTVARTSGVLLKTAQKKFGTASINISTGGNYFSCDDAWAATGTQDITFETWFYRLSGMPGGNNAAIADFRQIGSDNEPQLVMFDTGSMRLVVAGATRASTTLNLNQWYHLAFTRASGVWRLFVDGAQVGSDYTNNLTSVRRRMTCGKYADQRAGGTSNTVFGYWDDVRLTVGIACYAGGFSPPTQAFPNN